MTSFVDCLVGVCQELVLRGGVRGVPKPEGDRVQPGRQQPQEHGHRGHTRQLHNHRRHFLPLRDR